MFAVKSAVLLTEDWRGCPHLSALWSCFCSLDLDFSSLDDRNASEKYWAKVFHSFHLPFPIQKMGEADTAHHQVKWPTFGKLLQASGTLWTSFDQSSWKNTVQSMPGDTMFSGNSILKSLSVFLETLFPLLYYYHFSKRTSKLFKESKGEICGVW